MRGTIRVAFGDTHCLVGNVCRGCVRVAPSFLKVVWSKLCGDRYVVHGGIEVLLSLGAEGGDPTGALAWWFHFEAFDLGAR